MESLFLGNPEQKERPVGNSREVVELVLVNPRVPGSLVNYEESWTLFYGAEIKN